MEIQETGPQSPTYLGLQQKFIEFHINDKIEFNVHKPDELNESFKNAAKEQGSLGEVEDASLVICIDFTAENNGQAQTAPQPEQTQDQPAPEQTQEQPQDNPPQDDSQPSEQPSEQPAPEQNQDQAPAQEQPADDAQPQDQPQTDDTQSTADQGDGEQDDNQEDSSEDNGVDVNVSEADDGSGQVSQYDGNRIRGQIKEAVGKYFGINDPNMVELKDIVMKSDNSKVGFITVKYAKKDQNDNTAQ